MIPTLETERLRLTSLQPDDATALHAYRSHPDVVRFQSWHPASTDDAEKFIAKTNSVSFDTAGTWSQLAIREKESPTLIGDLGVHFVDPQSQQVEFGSPCLQNIKVKASPLKRCRR